MFQQTVLCHTTSQSKRREKGEQEKRKTSLQSKLFIEIVALLQNIEFGVYKKHRTFCSYQ